MTDTQESPALAAWGRRVGLQGLLVRDEDAARLDAILADAGGKAPRPTVQPLHVPTVDASVLLAGSHKITAARRAMRPALRRAAAASWEHGQDGLRYLAGRHRSCSRGHTDMPKPTRNAILVTLALAVLGYAAWRYWLPALIYLELARGWTGF